MTECEWRRGQGLRPGTARALPAFRHGATVTTTEYSDNIRRFAAVDAIFLLGPGGFISCRVEVIARVDFVFSSCSADNPSC